MIDGIIIFLSCFVAIESIFTLATLTDWLTNMGYNYGYEMRDVFLGNLVFISVLIFIIYILSLFTATF